MDILASQLRKKVPEAPIEECKKALQTMSMPQAQEYLKNKYSKSAIRKQNIDDLKDAFPEKNENEIISALDNAKDDFESAFQILLDNPASIVENKKSGTISKPVKKAVMKKREPFGFLKKPNLQNLMKDNQTANATIHPSTIKKPQSWILSHSPVITNIPTQTKSGSSILPRMEIPLSKIESSWNRSSISSLFPPRSTSPYERISQIYSSNKFSPLAKKVVYVDDSSDNDVTVLQNKKSDSQYDSQKNTQFETPYDTQYDDQYDYFEEEEEEEEFEELATKRIDLHGYLKDDAKFIVEDAIIHAKQNKIGVFHFITGIGNHSENNIPILRPMVQEVCKKLNVYSYIPKRNKGIVVCDVRMPCND